MSKYKLLIMNATAAASMINTSSNLVIRMSRALSSLSASWPKVAENKKNGKINRPALTLISTSGDGSLATWNAMSTIKAFLKMLSLKAPKNCVAKKGPKRRWPNNLNWDSDAKVASGVGGR